MSSQSTSVTLQGRQPSNEGRFSNSSGSLEALSRRSSNPDTPESTEAKRDTSNPLLNQQNSERQRTNCICSCTGWAEFYIRRPTGDMSWIMRIQNQMLSDPGFNEFPLHDLISIFMPSMGGISTSDVFSDASFVSSPTPSLMKSDNSITLPSSAKSEERTPKLMDVAQQQASDDRDIDVDEQEEPNESEDMDEDDADDMHSDIGDLAETGMRERSATESAITLTSTSGPINIPKAIDKNKVPSGSFSDVDPDDLDDGAANDDVAFDENEARSRNPVRRVNSSPEMSSNWRNTYTKGGPMPGGGTVVAANSSSSGGNAAPSQLTTTGDDETGDDAQQQKKKSFSKVSCEAIPEEIADSTPPQQSQLSELPRTAARDVEKPNDFQLNRLSAQNSLLPPASLPANAHKLTPTASDTQLAMPHNPPPKKQHSADDAVNVQEQQQQPQPQQKQAGHGPTKVKPNIEITKVISSKPPQSPTPLSPRLLAKTSSAKLSSGDFTRGRSKTISVMRGSEQDNRGNNTNLPIRGSEYMFIYPYSGRHSKY